MKFFLPNSNLSFSIQQDEEALKNGRLIFKCTADPVRPVIVTGRRLARHKRKVKGYQRYLAKCKDKKIEPSSSIEKPILPTEEKLTKAAISKAEATLASYVRGKRFLRYFLSGSELNANLFNSSVTTERIDERLVHTITLTKLESVEFGKGEGSKKKAEVRAESKKYEKDMNEYKKYSKMFKNAKTHAEKVEANKQCCFYYELLFGVGNKKLYTQTKEQFEAELASKNKEVETKTA